MAWQAPPTAITGTVATASDQNILRDDLLYLKSSAIVLNGTSDDVPNGTITEFTIGTGAGTACAYVEVFVNGLKRIVTTDYTHVSGEAHVDFTWAPATGDMIRFNYIPA